MKDRLAEITNLLYGLANGQPYKAPSYTTIQEFTDSFPKQVVAEFVSTPRPSDPEWQSDPPYPKIYTENYRKSLLSTL